MKKGRFAEVKWLIPGPGSDVIPSKAPPTPDKTSGVEGVPILSAPTTTAAVWAYGQSKEAKLGKFSLAPGHP
jgi:hypothetical protein